MLLFNAIALGSSVGFGGLRVKCVSERPVIVLCSVNDNASYEHITNDF